MPGYSKKLYFLTNVSSIKNVSGADKTIIDWSVTEVTVITLFRAILLALTVIPIAMELPAFPFSVTKVELKVAATTSADAFVIVVCSAS